MLIHDIELNLLKQLGAAMIPLYDGAQVKVVLKANSRANARHSSDPSQDSDHPDSAQKGVRRILDGHPDM